MADSTPPASQPEDAAAQSKPARKAPAAKRSGAAKKPSSRAKAADASGAAATGSANSADPAAEATTASAAPSPEPAVAASPAPQDQHGRSFLDRVRDNRVGAVTAGLVIALVVGLLLSVLVPSDPSVLAMVILGTLLAAAVGFTVRYLATGASLLLQAETFLVTVIGIHLMGVTGLVGGDVPLLSDLGVEGPGFNEALLVAFATPPVSTGGLLAGVVAAIIVGWGRRTDHVHGG
jgi:hypothetical protein